MTLLRNAAEASSDEDGWAHLAARATSSPSGRATVARSRAGSILLKLALTAAMVMSSVKVVTNTQRPRRFRTDTTAAARTAC